MTAVLSPLLRERYKIPPRWGLLWLICAILVDMSTLPDTVIGHCILEEYMDGGLKINVVWVWPRE